MDITQLILDDHHEQRRLFAILEEIDRSDITSLKAVWKRLSAHMEAHVQGEEEIFYPELLKAGVRAGTKDNTEDETKDAIKDHNEIRDAVAAVAKETVGGDAWLKAVAAVNKANSDHMAEEEREGLTDFRRQTDVQFRHALAVRFAAFEAANFEGVTTLDKDPKTYIKQNE